MKKFIMLIKDKWLRQTSLTLLLVAIILAIFIAGNFLLSKANLNPIDFTKEKIYTLSDESKNLVKDIEQNVTIYFFGYEDESTAIVLGNQYHDVNEKIAIKKVSTSDRPDLVAKFGLSDSSQIIAVTSANQRYKLIDPSDTSVYDNYSGSASADLTEQKLTNAILNVTVESKPQIYFLTGHNEYGIEKIGEYGSAQDLYYLAQLITNEIMDVHTLDLLTTKEMPKECDVLVIANPKQDFTDSEAEAIQTYINNGGKIMWMQDPYLNIRNYNKDNFKNINKILDQFGISFSYGMVFEQDQNSILDNNGSIFMPMLTYNSIVKDFYSDGKVIFFGAGKINNVSSEKMEELKVTTNEFIKSTDKSFYKENLNDIDQSAYLITKSKSDESGSFILGETITKKLDDNENGKTSTLVAFSNCLFTVNYINELQVYPVVQRNNKDLILNTISYLANREDAISIKKSYR